MSAFANSSSSIPLFDRIAEPDGFTQDGPTALADALRASIARDLARLLNTRSRLGFEAFAECEGSVLDYGMPDFTARSMESGEDRDAIAAAMARAIALFEPRLANVTVHLAPASVTRRAPPVAIRGEMRAGAAVHHVAFELAADAAVGADARWRAHG
jgi:type VI secretion system protein ImpF